MMQKLGLDDGSTDVICLIERLMATLTVIYRFIACSDNFILYTTNVLENFIYILHLPTNLHDWLSPHDSPSLAFL